MGEGENNQGGWKWFNITIIGGLAQLGGGVCLKNLKMVVFLAKHISFIYFMRTVMFLIHLHINSGSVECTSSYLYSKNYICYHFICPKIN